MKSVLLGCKVAFCIAILSFNSATHADSTYYVKVDPPSKEDTKYYKDLLLRGTDGPYMGRDKNRRRRRVYPKTLADIKPQYIITTAAGGGALGTSLEVYGSIRDKEEGELFEDILILSIPVTGATLASTNAGTKDRTKNMQTPVGSGYIVKNDGRFGISYSLTATDGGSGDWVSHDWKIYEEKQWKTIRKEDFNGNLIKIHAKKTRWMNGWFDSIPPFLPSYGCLMPSVDDMQFFYLLMGLAGINEGGAKFPIVVRSSWDVLGPPRDYEKARFQ